jgi:hypothetical protein
MTFTRRRLALVGVVWLTSCGLTYQGCCALALRLGWQPKEPADPTETRTVDVGRVLVERWKSLMELGCAEFSGTVPVCYRVWAGAGIEVPLDRRRTVPGWASFQFADGRTCTAQYEMSALVRERPQTSARDSAFIDSVELDQIRLERRLQPPQEGPPLPLHGITPGEVVLVNPEPGSPLWTEHLELFLPERPDIWVQIGRRGPAPDVDVRVARISLELEKREVWADGTTKVSTPRAGLYQVTVTEKSRPSGIPRPFTISVIWGDHWGTECPQGAEKIQ